MLKNATDREVSDTIAVACQICTRHEREVERLQGDDHAQLTAIGMLLAAWMLRVISPENYGPMMGEFARRVVLTIADMREHAEDQTTCH